MGLIWCFLIFCLVVPTECSMCGKSLLYHQSRDKCIKQYSKPVTSWYMARSLCRDLVGGDLLIITDSSIKQFITRHYTVVSTLPMWIGLKYTTTIGFVWVDGTSLNKNGYVGWGAIKPTGQPGQCVGIEQGIWRDMPCTKFMPGFFCEIRNVNKCNVNNGGCEHQCKVEDAVVECSCRNGYNLTMGFRCEDIDECTTQSKPCPGAQKCVNLDGSFYCECLKGYTMKGRVCEDIDECLVRNGNCHYHCNNTIGSFTCGCYAGYTGTGNNCLDIDECKSGPNRCKSICFNTIGSYRCSCSAGYVSTGGAICGDIDECKTNNAGCTDKCVNTIGSFECDCDTGYVFNVNGTCEDEDECVSLAGTCDSICENTVGSFKCHCKPGYELVKGKCYDIDECTTNQAGCEHVCINHHGSFNCTCQRGYEVRGIIHCRKSEQSMILYLWLGFIGAIGTTYGFCYVYKRNNKEKPPTIIPLKKRISNAMAKFSMVSKRSSSSDSSSGGSKSNSSKTGKTSSASI